MGRPRTPSNILDITGAYRKNPQRRHTGEPAPPNGIGSAPDSLPTDSKACWDELASNACPGTLGNSDRLWLERAACLLAKSRNKPDEFTSSNETALQAYLCKLGMNPADRSRLRVSPNKPDPDDEYFK